MEKISAKVVFLVHLASLFSIAYFCNKIYLRRKRPTALAAETSCGKQAPPLRQLHKNIIIFLIPVTCQTLS